MKKRVPRRPRISLALALSVPALLAGVNRELQLRAKRTLPPVRATQAAVLKKRIPDTAQALTLDLQGLAARKNVQ